MIRIITGQTGEGKTKKMIDCANEIVSSLKGHAVYIDSNTNHRLALSHQIRLVEASTFPLGSEHDFFGFLCGLLASNHDIEVVFIDELIKITHSHIHELTHLFDRIRLLSERYNVEFIIGASCSTKELPPPLTPYLIA